MNERDFERFNTNYEIQEGEDGCWLWTDKPTTYGYGCMRINKKQQKAHRISLYHHTQDAESFNNPKILARHSCRNRHCVNPQHLSWGTSKENMNDKIRDGTLRNGERHSQSKLTETQVREIRTRIDELHKDLAIEYGVTQSAISLIIHNKTWKHI